MSSLNGLRWSLAVTWIATAIVSAWEWHGMSTQLLLDAGLSSHVTRGCLLLAGIGVDFAMGLALWRWPGHQVYRLAIAQVLLMTVVGTWMLPNLWLHPLGPLLKNLPILAILSFLDDLHTQS